MESSWDNLITTLGFDPKVFSVVKHFDDDYNGNSEIGDLFTVPSRFKGIYHAGVLYDEEMIVHYMKKNQYERALGSFASFSFSSSSNSSPGLIEFALVEVFSGGQKFAIYRKKDGIDVQTFKANVRKRMKEEPEYNLFSYNCIHFAMEIIGLKANNLKQS